MGKIRVTEYSNSKEILKYDHYVSQAIVLETSNGTSVGDKKIVKAGTILPANDATAKGVLLYDVDVTHGNATGALVIHGFIDKTKIPAQPNELVNLPMIMFI
nr:hypothetical protein [uncultured Terrisporobacter sp.]